MFKSPPQKKQSSSVHPAFRGRQHSRRRIFLKRKYCTIVTSQPSREDRAIEKKKSGAFFEQLMLFFNISFFLFPLYKHVKSPVSLTQTHMKFTSVCFLLFFLIYRLCVTNTHNQICRRASMSSIIQRGPNAHTSKHAQAHMHTGGVWVVTRQFCTLCFPVLCCEWQAASTANQKRDFQPTANQKELRASKATS